MADNLSDIEATFNEDNLKAIEGCSKVAKDVLERESNSIDEAVLNGALTSLEQVPALVAEIRRMYNQIGISNSEGEDWPEFPNKCAGDGFFYAYDDPVDACQGCPNCGEYGSTKGEK